MELQSQPHATDTEIVQDSVLHTPREATNVSMFVVLAKVVASKFLKVLQMRMP